VCPFLFRVRDSFHIRLDWEHTEVRWIDPSEIVDIDTVPIPKETWEKLWKR